MKYVTAIIAEFRLTDWLSLAAAPTFALMAILTATAGGGEGSCSMHMSPLGGMVPMYVLMSGFHGSPWLKLLAHWRGAVRAV